MGHWISNYIVHMNLSLTRLVGAASALLLLPVSLHAQILSCAEVQGETDISPYEGQTVTISGKVTEYFGDTWYIQDDFGAWNGIYCVGPDVIVDANPPWWNADRQPEVGDVFELTGTVVEQDGNTQLVDITITFPRLERNPAGIWAHTPTCRREPRGHPCPVRAGDGGDRSRCRRRVDGVR